MAEEEEDDGDLLGSLTPPPPAPLGREESIMLSTVADAGVSAVVVVVDVDDPFDEGGVVRVAFVVVLAALALFVAMVIGVCVASRCCLLVDKIIILDFSVGRSVGFSFISLLSLRYEWLVRGFEMVGSYSLVTLSGK